VANRVLGGQHGVVVELNSHVQLSLSRNVAGVIPVLDEVGMQGGGVVAESLELSVEKYG
jgi:hypothetical protein